jgi:dipeptidyl aminopeptidase/acylaminoacyl peptidase
VSISLPPRPPEVEHQPPLDHEALIEEARRRARRRRQRNLAGFVAAILGALWLYSLLGGSGPELGSAFLSESSSQGATPPKAALPEELTYNANGGVVLIRRDGTRRELARATYRHLPNGRLDARMYNAIEWSRDGSRLLALRWGSPRALIVLDVKGSVGPTIAQALDGRWSPDGARIGFVRHERGLGRVLFLAASDGRSPMRIATHLGSFSWSPDGTRLAYTRTDASGLFIARADDHAAPRRVAIAAGVGAAAAWGLGEQVQWSPDGSLIALGTGSGVLVVRPNGTSLRRVTARGSWIAWSQNAWSPNSRLLAVTMGTDIYVVRPDGGGLRRIASCPCTFRGATGTSLAWSPDGSRIAYISGRGNDVSTVRPDGSASIVVAPRAVPGPSGLAVGWPLWRPGRDRG